MLFADSHRHHPIIEIAIIAGEDGDNQPDAWLDRKPLTTVQCRPCAGLEGPGNCFSAGRLSYAATILVNNTIQSELKAG